MPPMMILLLEGKGASVQPDQDVTLGKRIF